LEKKKIFVELSQFRAKMTINAEQELTIESSITDNTLPPVSDNGTKPPLTKVHEKFMKIALSIASEALHLNEVPVGCVFVKDNTIIQSGRNATNLKFNATRHAEFEAIDAILEKYDKSVFRDCTLYVTVERECCGLLIGSVCDVCECVEAVGAEGMLLWVWKR
jgi:pyrimidine deaminase RibD-like protein